MKKKPFYPSKKNTQNNKGNTRVANYSNERGAKKQDYAKVNGGVFVYSKPISVADLSKAINVPVPAIIKFLFLQGKAVTINQLLDDESIGEICLQFNYDFKKEKIQDAVQIGRAHV